MNNDVFISYSSVDKHVADAICSSFENSGIRCWIAPRDILPGSDWATSIVDAIKSSKIMVLIFSKSSNGSSQVTKELNLAVSHNLMIIPFKIDDSMPSGKMEYFLADVHWLDAINGDIKSDIDLLKSKVAYILPHTSNDIIEEEATSIEVIPTEEKNPVKEEEKKPVREKKKLFAEYGTMWKRAFDFKGVTLKQDFKRVNIQALAVWFSVMLIISLLGFDSHYLSNALAVIFIALPTVGIIPHISLCIRFTRSMGKRRSVTALLGVFYFLCSAIILAATAFFGIVTAFIILSTLGM